ncbi:hypothetical protein C8A00DRAFT_36292 [Chaetomidium leptoderma]|uniref:Uncharacterized protein n=1 Tax=Chaetomidium leptoderma TaxID=669021 RepID=A0AAN6VGH6_9PEZI|nr:hypothetical protein C8A00DRAFT_36292 [Chaetomidium leptoderma]
MKPIAYAAALLGLVSAALGQEALAPSPTESVGCEPHGDHWHCEGPRVTSESVGAVTSASTAVVTSSATQTEGDHDHGEGEGEHHTDEHTDATGTGSLKPSPTESYGCEPHGDHWHCEGPVTAAGSGSVAPTLVTTTTTRPPTGASETTASTPPASTAAAPRYEVAGLGFAGLAAVAAMAL